ncbi:MAG: DUF1934 domain-containing protein [Clostridiaceae bacterium]|nr:DUF1934 domain-containing protein [Clostridiaceae bacterium]
MRKDVIISVSGTGGTLRENMELITEGKYIKKGQEYFVEYDESIVTGMEGTKTVLHVNQNKVTLTRSGKVNSQFVFEQGLNHFSHYDIREGAFTVEVFTEYMKVDIGDEGGSIKVAYHIRIDDNQYVENDFNLSVREITKN